MVESWPKSNIEGSQLTLIWVRGDFVSWDSDLDHSVPILDSRVEQSSNVT